MLPEELQEGRKTGPTAARMGRGSAFFFFFNNLACNTLPGKCPFPQSDGPGDTNSHIINVEWRHEQIRSISTRDYISCPQICTFELALVGEDRIICDKSTVLLRTIGKNIKTNCLKERELWKQPGPEGMSL